MELYYHRLKTKMLLGFSNIFVFDLPYWNFAMMLVILFLIDIDLNESYLTRKVSNRFSKFVSLNEWFRFWYQNKVAMTCKIIQDIVDTHTSIRGDDSSYFVWNAIIQLPVIFFGKYSILTHYSPVLLFYIPWKQKT